MSNVKTKTFGGYKKKKNLNPKWFIYFIINMLMSLILTWSGENTHELKPVRDSQV